MGAKEALGQSEEQLVAFQLDNETYGVNISIVREIIRLQTITEVPKTPYFVEGVINLRGNIIPVIDLHKRFDLSQKDQTQHSRIMVVEVEEVTVGMIVDSVSEVLRIPIDKIDPPPPAISGLDSAYLRGVGKLEDRLIMLLDLNQVLHEKKEEISSSQETE